MRLVLPHETSVGSDGARGLMRLNWRQGFFRFWVIGSALFVMAAAWISYGDIKSQFDQAATMKLLEHDKIMLPVLCGKARGVEGTDFQRGLFDDLIPSAKRDTSSPPNPFDNCWYQMPKFRVLYPEYNDLSDRELSSKLYADVGIPTRDLPNPWMTMLGIAAVAFGIPLIVLIFGLVLAWGFSGFKAKHQLDDT
jgi:hypothetical protein